MKEPGSLGHPGHPAAEVAVKVPRPGKEHVLRANVRFSNRILSTGMRMFGTELFSTMTDVTLKTVRVSHNINQ